jgi:hypothetical protein
MPRKKSSNLISNVLASAERLKNDISAVPIEIQNKLRELAMAIVSKPVKRRGRPPKKRGRPRKRGRPKKRGRTRKTGTETATPM